MTQAEIIKEIEKIFAKCTPEEVQKIKHISLGHLGVKGPNEKKHPSQEFKKLVEAVEALPDTESMKQIAAIFCKLILEIVKEIKPLR